MKRAWIRILPLLVAILLPAVTLDASAIGGETVLYPGHTSADEGNGETPRTIILEQNFPNPFSAMTTIRYAIPGRSYVRLVVFTMVGNPIAVLINGVQDAGSYAVDFTAPDLPPGFYYYQLQTEFGMITRRMTVSR